MFLSDLSSCSIKFNNIILTNALITQVAAFMPGVFKNRSIVNPNRKEDRYTTIYGVLIGSKIMKSIYRKGMYTPYMDKFFKKKICIIISNTNFITLIITVFIIFY